MTALAHPGLVCITDEVAAGIAAEQALELLGELRSAAVETDLGPAVLLRDIERLVVGGRS